MRSVSPLQTQPNDGTVEGTDVMVMTESEKKEFGELGQKIEELEERWRLWDVAHGGENDEGGGSTKSSPM